MAGTMPEGGASGTGRRGSRRQWTLHHEGPRGSLRRLRSTLAEDGCDRSQLVLARQLLEAPAAGAEARDNHEQAVYWLVRASEQGNADATELLQSCLDTGQGVTDQNYVDVRNCLDMPLEEKLTRRAARKLFNKLAEGQEFVTTEQIRRRLQRAASRDEGAAAAAQPDEDWDPEDGDDDAGGDGDDVRQDEQQPQGSDGEAAAEGGESAAEGKPPSRRRRVMSFFRRVGRGEKLSEDSLVAAASHLVNGDLPSINKLLCISDDEEDFLQMSLVEKVLFHPIRTVNYGYQQMVRTLSERGNGFLMGMIPTTQLKTVLVVFLMSFLDAGLLLVLVPVLLLYLALFTMLISTLQMLQLHQDLGNFRVWSRVMRIMASDLNAELAEARFRWKNLFPYVRFFVAMLVAVVALQYVPTWLVLSSEITALSTLMTCLTFISLNERHQWLAWLSMTLHAALAALRALPHLRPPTLFSLQVAPALFLDVSVPALLHVAGLICYVGMATRQRWHGTYQMLVPHLASVVWFQLAVLFADGASGGGVVRAMGLFFGTVLALPIVGGFLLILPALAVGRQLYEAGFLLQTVVTLALMVLPLLLARLRQRHGSFRSLLSSYQAVALLLGVVSLLPAIHVSYLTEPPRTDPALLPWGRFNAVCHGSALQTVTTAQAQHGCQLLEGARVAWEGAVADVRIRSQENKLQKLLSVLPAGVQQSIACVYGRPMGDCNAELMSGQELERCLMAQHVMTERCSLRNWNRYQFDMVVHMPPAGFLNTSPEVLLEADDRFQAFGLNLLPGDRVSFRGQLTGGLGTARPIVLLSELRCISCATTVAPVAETTHRDVINEAAASAGAILNFICSPLLRYEQHPDGS